MATSWVIDFSNEYVLTNGGRILLSSGDVKNFLMVQVKAIFAERKFPLALTIK